MVKEMEEQKEMIDAYDWAQWEKKGLDAATIAEVKAVMAAGVDAEKGMLGDTKGAFEAMEKEISAAFKGPGGFLELAAGEEKAAAAGMAKCVRSRPPRGARLAVSPSQPRVGGARGHVARGSLPPLGVSSIGCSHA